jgi:predicted CXXCH cytochrome family protein
MTKGRSREVPETRDSAPAVRASDRTRIKEVVTMRRLALLLAGGALWLLFAAAPAFADGGPHVLANNNGTAGLAGDCAACHRAHTAQAASLLKEEMPGLCLSCHDGTGSTVDVVDGVQFVPATWTHNPLTSPVLGALRGGGWEFALIGAPARLSYGSGTSVRFTAHVGVGTSTPVTSTHKGGTGTVWGNGAVGSGVGASTGIVLDCARCHNPHGNGQYRILQTTPGEDWSTGVNGFTVSVSAGVQVQDTANPTNAIRNYTVLPGVLATDVTAPYTAGDYWRYKYDPTGATTWTTTTNVADPMNTGWQSFTQSYVDSTGTTKYLFRYPVNTVELAASNTARTAVGQPTIPTLNNNGGLMTAWCIQCHTRYNGFVTVVPNASPATGFTTSPSSLTKDSADSIFSYKHGTSRIGCEQCHVSHGTNALMVPGSASANVNYPNSNPLVTTGSDDSRLLKVNNRGTCNLCHDPTGTVIAGTYTGPTPTPGL